MILTVDLASKMSAGMVRHGSEILHEFNSLGKPSLTFAKECASTAKKFEVELAVFEDVPYGVSSQAQTKPVTRLQGAVIVYMAHLDLLDRTRFLNPSTWQNTFPGVARAPKEIPKNKRDAYRLDAARKHAEERGYTPPLLVDEYIASLAPGTKILKKHTDPLTKVMGDYIDAFLISEWIQSFPSIEAVKDVTGMQEPYI